MKKIILILAILFTTGAFAQYATFKEGKIKVYNKLPKKWETSNGTIWNFRSADSATIYSYGFRNIIQPTLTTYQKRDTIYFDIANDVFTYAIKDFTQTEIERYNESELDSDNSATKEMKLENDGQQLYRKIKNRIRRKLNKGRITKNQFNNIRRVLRPAILPLRTGDWDIVQENLNAIKPPNNAKLLAILNTIKGLVNDYITLNY